MGFNISILCSQYLYNNLFQLFIFHTEYKAYGFKSDQKNVMGCFFYDIHL